MKNPKKGKVVFKNPTFASVAVLIGAMIGAGFLGIPHVVAKSGFIIGAIHIIFLGIIMLIVNLYLGEVTLRTKGNNQLTGYAEKYIGKTGKTITLLVLIFGIFSSLIAYLIGISESISQILIGSGEISFQIALVVWAFLSLITFFGVNVFKEGEIIGLFLMGAFLIGIVAVFAPQININNLTYTNPSQFFAPFGVILFSFLSLAALPELERILENNKEKMKKAIILGSIIPIIGYLLFTIVVVGVTGSNASEVSTISLGPVFILLGIITMSTSYLALMTVLKSIFHFDYKVPRKMAWIIISALILNIYLLIKDQAITFSSILGTAGIISGTAMVLLILLMVEKAKKHGERDPEYIMPLNRILILIIILVFIAGGALSLFN